MISWIASLFSGKPRNCDRAFQDLARMLWEDNDNPTFKRELLRPPRLDFSLESLKHVDEYLEMVHKERPEEDQLFRVVLRAGAYVGEVIRHLRPGEYRWVEHGQAAKYSKLISSMEPSLGTAAILWKNPEDFCFPLGKVCKYVDNGGEDSVHFFAVVVQKQCDQRAPT